jgi:hypothetical protein
MDVHRSDQCTFIVSILSLEPCYTVQHLQAALHFLHLARRNIGWMDGWMDGWMHGWTDPSTATMGARVKFFFSPSSVYRPPIVRLQRTIEKSTSAVRLLRCIAHLPDDVCSALVLCRQATALYTREPPECLHESRPLAGRRQLPLLPHIWKAVSSAF